MRTQSNGHGLGRFATPVYTAISVLAAATFYTLAQAKGGYPAVAVYGGALWVFLLSMIVTMPLVTAWAKSLCPPSPPEGGRG